MRSLDGWMKYGWMMMDKLISVDVTSEVEVSTWTCGVGYPGVMSEGDVRFERN